MAMKLFQKRREQAQAAAQNQDYIEERWYDYRRHLP
jgi:hypothetical protein